MRVVGREWEAARARPRDTLRYLLRSRELSNFTYELTNMDELAACVADALAVDPGAVEEKIAELREDGQLRRELERALAANPKRDSRARFGYRYLYYCVARLRRPKTVVEVGTHDGLGAAVLAEALERNHAEGSPGTLVTLDANPDAAWLIPGRLRPRCHQVTGDLAETLRPAILEHGCDFLIDDIGFAFDGKPALFETGLELSDRELVIGSEFPRRADGDPPTALARIAAARSGRYAEFSERPERHFSPGHTQALALFEEAT